MTRLEVVSETLCHALNILATMTPDWLRARTTPDWIDHYGLRASEFRLPRSHAKRQAWAKQIGADGRTLLTAVYADTVPSDLRTIPAVEILRQVWLQNFMVIDTKLIWRENDTIPPTGRFIGSPYDSDARYATKRDTHWIGYKLHLTKTYGGDRPNLITNVETTHAAVADDAVTETIHASPAEHDLLPDIHVADTGYVNSPCLSAAKRPIGLI